MPDDPFDLDRLADPGTDPALARVVQRGYLPWFPAAGRVLDVGCGLGGFLEVLRDAGRTGVGIERSAAAVERCRRQGLAVEVGDAIAVLAELRRRGERFDGALLAHVIEHLPAQQAAGLLAAIGEVLRDGAPLVVVTPNFRSLIVATELFWLDPTHVRPYPRKVLERLGALVGFGIRASYDDPATVPRRSAVRRWLARLRSVATGADRSAPLDAVVVLERRSGGGAGGGAGGTRTI